MATVTTVTIGTDDFSVYALTADPNTDTDSFWNVRLGAERTAWEAATEDDQNRAMVVAADWIDRASSFTGTKTVSTQARAWPRDDATCSGAIITDGTTPDAVFYAQAWLAGKALADSSAAASSGEGSNIRSVKAGSAQVEFFRPTIGEYQDTRLPQVAHDYLKCLLEGANATVGLIGPTARGTTRTSSFAEDDYELNEGYA